MSSLQTDTERGPFSLSELGRDRGPVGKGLATLARPTLEWLLAMPTLNGIYADAAALPADRHFAQRALDAMHVEYLPSEQELARIPRSGPLVVVANHPFGGLDGLILIALLQRVRPDVRVLANFILGMVPDLRGLFLYVDPFGGSGAAQRNVGAMRNAMRWVQSGGVLGVFPAGEVSHLNLRRRSIMDPPWSETVARIVQRTKAPVLPVYFEGRNSRLFELLGLMHPRLRTLMLPRELVKKRHSKVTLRVGNVIAPQRWERFDNPGEMTAYLRVRTYILQGRGEAGSAEKDEESQAPHAATAPVIDPVPVERLEDEVARLPVHQRLASVGDLSVHYFAAEQGAALLREIGRLREIAFRAVGEGTGREVDLDRFDPHYLHLFVWNHEKRLIVGAYRMGLTDRIVASQGVSGLYTSTLFHFRSKGDLLAQLNPAIELGRSFVRVEYQRDFAPLTLLWRGIALYVAHHPRYRRLFGPVSISNRYSSLTRWLLMAFLEASEAAPGGLSKLLSPRHPPRLAPRRDFDERAVSTLVRGVDEVDELVRDIEADRLSMPVLLRQYLRLNAKLLGFNVDPDFGDVLDGLMLVDLTRVTPAILVRYMGKEKYAQFMSHHVQQ